MGGDEGGRSGRLKKKLSASKTIEKNTPGSSGDGAATKKRARNISSSPTSPAAAVSAAKSGNPMRDRVRGLLATALYREDEGHVESKAEADAVGVEIEVAMYDAYKEVNQDYKMKARELKFNFADDKNKDLRGHVLTRGLSAEDVVKMSSKELANAEVKEERTKLHKHFLREAAAGSVQQATTDQFKCGKCKKRQCTYYQMQTRSADEPLTTFVQCVACGNRWRFC